MTLLAEVMERRPRAFLGYYHWQIYYLTTKGSILLPEGYRATEPIPVQEVARPPSVTRVQSVPLRLTKSTMASASSGRQTIRSGSETSSWL